MSISPATLKEAFESNFRDAFRLELLTEYWIEAERPHFENFKQGGERPEIAIHQGWLEMLDNLSEDQRVRRCRVYSYPLSAYVQFEAKWGYSLSKEHGEEIRFIRREDAETCLAQLPIAKDFWMFDSQHVFLMNYDFLGRFLGSKRVDEPAEYVNKAAELYGSSMAQDQFFSSMNIEA